MNRLKHPIYWLLTGILTLCLASCGISQGSPSNEALMMSPRPPSPERDIIQPDPEHPVTREDYELFIANYDTEYMAYNMVVRYDPQLYLALGLSNVFLPGLPNESIEGSADIRNDDLSLLKVHLTVDRPHDGGTVDGVLIDFFYNSSNDSVSDLSVEAFTSEEDIVYTIDYTEENALEDGRLLSKVVSTFEEYIQLNDIK